MWNVQILDYKSLGCVKMGTNKKQHKQTPKKTEQTHQTNKNTTKSEVPRVPGATPLILSHVLLPEIATLCKTYQLAMQSMFTSLTSNNTFFLWTPCLERHVHSHVVIQPKQNLHKSRYPGIWWKGETDALENLSSQLFSSKKKTTILDVVFHLVFWMSSSVVFVWVVFVLSAFAHWLLIDRPRNWPPRSLFFFAGAVRAWSSDGHQYILFWLAIPP